MTQDEQKRLVAREAVKYVIDDTFVGVGSGSTANYFVDELAKIKHRIKGAVASSLKTAERSHIAGHLRHAAASAANSANRARLCARASNFTS